MGSDAPVSVERVIAWARVTWADGTRIRVQVREGHAFVSGERLVEDDPDASWTCYGRVDDPTEWPKIGMRSSDDADPFDETWHVSTRERFVVRDAEDRNVSFDINTPAVVRAEQAVAIVRARKETTR